MSDDEIVLKGQSAYALLPSYPIGIGWSVATLGFSDHIFGSAINAELIIVNMITWIVLLALAARLIPGVSYLKINSEGIEYRYLIRTHKYYWNEISQFQVVEQTDFTLDGIADWPWVFRRNAMVGAVWDGVVFGVLGARKMPRRSKRTRKLRPFTHFLGNFGHNRWMAQLYLASSRNARARSLARLLNARRDAYLRPQTQASAVNISTED